MNPPTETCNICRRTLDCENDPLSADCGGDCWGCIGEIEADMGCEYSLRKVREEYSSGLRPGWIPSPNVVLTQSGGGATHVLVEFVHPSGGVWPEVEFTLSFDSKDVPKNQSETIESVVLVADRGGAAQYEYSFPKLKRNNTAWVSVELQSMTWSKPALGCDTNA